MQQSRLLQMNARGKAANTENMEIQSTKQISQPKSYKNRLVKNPIVYLCFPHSLLAVTP